MTTEAFDHLSAFGLAAAQIPARKAARLLAAETQLDVIGAMLADREAVRTSLRELREADPGRVNYLDAVRGDVARKWQPVVENLERIPRPRLLADVDGAWKAAEAKTAGETQQRVTAILAERAAQKAAIVEAAAGRVAAERGLPATARWIESLQQQCDQARALAAQDLAKFSEQRKRQVKAVGQLKDDWTKLLGADDGAVAGMARRFLLLAAGVLGLGYALWVLSIPVDSFAGLGAVVLTVLLALLAARPLFERLRYSRRTVMTASNLVGAYRASSLLGLDEMAKRQEVDYANTLRAHLDELLDRYRERIAQLEARRAELLEEQQALQATLYHAPPTVRVILRDDTLAEWRARGRTQAPVAEWRRGLGSVSEPIDWQGIDAEAQAAFAFVRAARIEDEICRAYPLPETRMGFLRSLRDAAIGTTPGEAFLSLDLGVTAGKMPQTFLFVEVDDPTTSPLAQEISAAWGGTGVGVSLVRSSDPTMLTFIGLVYGYRLDAQRDWPGIEAAFQQVVEREGPSIFPVLFPGQADGSGEIGPSPTPTSAGKLAQTNGQTSAGGNGARKPEDGVEAE